MSEIKRVWSDKKTTWNDKEQVWLKDGELKKYDWEWRDVEGSIQVYEGSAFETLPWSAELDTYDSNTPEFIGTVEDWIEAAYVFKDWDGTVLASGKVKDWGTPTAPEDPTRDGYEFTGWNPTVWPITKSTEYIAQYEQVIVNYTVTITVNDDTMWSVSTSEVVVADGTEVTTGDNELYLGETTVTATAEEGYEFAWWEWEGWDPLPVYINGDTTIVAVFTSTWPWAFDIPRAISWNDWSNDIATLFADSSDAEDRVDIEFGTDAWTGDPTATITGYGIYGISDPTTDLQQAALISALSDIDAATLMTQFANWATYAWEYGTIVTTLMQAFKDAWDNYETTSYWTAVKTIINDTTNPVVNTDTVFAQSVGQPDENSVTVTESDTTSVRFNYLPTTVTPLEWLTNVLDIVSADDSVAEAYINNISYDGEAILDIYWVWAWTTTITYGISWSQDTYTVSVTVTASQEPGE